MSSTLQYPKEMQVFLLQNTALIERGTLTEAVEATIFTAIHERITQKLERRLWELHCDPLNIGDTMFAPMHWPRRKDNGRQVYYSFNEYGAGNNYWLSCLLGLNETQTCFELHIDGRLGGPKVNVEERVQTFYAETPALHELGWVCTEESLLRLPFSFDAAQLAEVYPDLRKPMLAFEKVFDKLLKANEHIDKLITGMVPAGANPSQGDDAVKEPAAAK
jgi:hypothetical protein